MTPTSLSSAAYGLWPKPWGSVDLSSVVIVIDIRGGPGAAGADGASPGPGCRRRRGAPGGASGLCRRRRLGARLDQQRWQEHTLTHSLDMHGIRKILICVMDIVADRRIPRP